MIALALVLHAAMMLAVAPLLQGAIAWLGRAFARTRGAPPWQTLRDLARLARKERLVPEGSATAAIPLVDAAATLAAAVVVPSFATGLPIGGGDLLVVFGLMGLSRAALLLADVDAGGAAVPRLTGLLWTVPSLVVAAAVLGQVAPGTRLDTMLAGLRDAGPSAPTLLATAGLALAGLDHPGGDRGAWSGRDLALLDAASWLRRLLWCDLMGALALPYGLADAPHPATWPLGLAAWAARTTLAAVCLAAVATAAGSLSRQRRAELGAAGLLLAGLGLLLLIVGQAVA